jgi:hypothetical protein
MNTKTITKTEWASMELVSAPTATIGEIRRDADGDAWVWVSSGKRVTMRRAR